MDQLQLSRRSFVKASAGLAALGLLAPLANLGVTTARADEGGTRLVLGRSVDSDNLDPVTCIGNQNIFVFNLIVEGLVKTSDDGKSIEPCLAESWEVSDDSKTYTFKLKEGLKFSDGSDVTAADWQWTFDRAMQSPDSHWYSCVENLEKVECPDDTTVIVTTKEAAASTLANLSIFEIGVQSKAYFDQVGADKYVDGPIGTGPFKLVEWKKGEYITFQANENYRESGLPLAKEIELKVVGDDNARLIQLQGGDIDIAENIPFSTMAQLSNDPSVTPHPDASTMVYWLSLNTKNEYLANEKVRQALFKATDAQQIVDMVSYGYAQTAGTVISPSSEYCDTSLQAPKADIEAAKKLLEEAGYPGGGFSLRLLMRGGNATNEQISVVLQSQWSQIGVTLQIDSREATAYSAARQEMDLDLIISGWSDDVPDPTSLMQFIFDFDTNCGYYSNFEQPEDMQQLNAQATIELDVEKRKDLYKQIQQGFAAQGIYIPLMTIPWQNCIRKEVTGFVQTPLGNYRFENLTKTA